MDTDPSGQRVKALTQHKKLAEAIQEATSSKVTYVPILLGVSGAIYKETYRHLDKTLGINGSALKSLANQLNLHAVKTLHAIYTTKRKKETGRHDKCTIDHKAHPD